MSEDKALQEMDIDDILSRAETQATTEDTSHSDLLSQFKVASFAMEEDQLAPPPSATPTEGKTFLLSPRGRGQAPVVKSWEELIPEEARRVVDEEEKTKEQLDLYLPPRRRKVRVSNKLLLLLLLLLTMKLSLRITVRINLVHLARQDPEMHSQQKSPQAPPLWCPRTSVGSQMLKYAAL